MTGQERRRRRTGIWAGAPDTSAAAPGAPTPEDRWARAEEIERTRAELAAMAEALAARAGVKARLREQARAVSARLTSTAREVNAQLGFRTQQLFGRFTGTMAAARQAALSVAGPVKQRVTNRAGQVRATSWRPRGAP